MKTQADKSSYFHRAGAARGVLTLLITGIAVILETRVKSTKSYEIIVRMADGSSRVFNDANPARGRTGERLIVIGGVRPSNR
jgi:hypothetical protein